MRAVPLVSVVMSAYNSERYLGAAVESILAQTFADFELIVVDDGSTDGTAQILRACARRDRRVRVFRLERNQGIVTGVNYGLARARGTYIARMDSDDVCRPERFERQVQFMESHPDVGLLGSGTILLDPSGRELGRESYPADDARIRWASLISNPFAQPTVMLRRALLEEHHLGYRPGLLAEDYDLWVRLLQFSRGANLPAHLLEYRVHDTSVSSRREEQKIDLHAKVSYEHIRRTLPDFQISPEGHRDLIAAVNGFRERGLRSQRPRAARLYTDLWQAYARTLADDPVLPEMRRETALLAAKIGLYPPFMRGWSQVIPVLFQLYPGWVAGFILSLPHMITLKLRGLRLRALRNEE